jgi:hypothetical protein
MNGLKYAAAKTTVADEVTRPIIFNSPFNQRFLCCVHRSLKLLANIHSEVSRNVEN